MIPVRPADGDGARSTQQEAAQPGVFGRFKERIQRYRALHLTWRFTILAVGVAIICAGLAMLVLPGPGWAAIFVGLAVLASEFRWADRLLGWAKDKARRATARALDPKHRRRNTAIGVVVLLVLAAGCWWYVAAFGWPDFMQWVFDLF